MTTHIIVDAQNDFITGTLGSDYAKQVADAIANLIPLIPEDDHIVSTLDTHEDTEYLHTQEGHKLPIKHCINGTWGHNLYNPIDEAIHKRHKKPDILYKSTFAVTDWKPDYKTDKFYIYGFVTDICVISNALWLRSFYPETPIVVVETLCAGTSSEAHKAALKVMESCQVEVI